MKKAILIIFLPVLTLCGMEAQVIENLPAFPQAEGFGAWSSGGRGGKVIFVDNLNDDGPGSFRAAVNDPDSRIVIFRVSGTIELESHLMIQHPFITVAGHTAPGDGICLKKYLLKIDNTHDVVVRGIRVRPGIESGLTGASIDGIDVQNSHSVIIDHCTASWSCDEILNTNKNTRDITVQWCLFSESLNNSVHEKGEHGYAATIGGYRTSYHHNLFAHNKGRNPSIGGSDNSRTEQLDFRNNVVYNWISRVCDGKPRTMNFVSNYYKQGPATPENNEYIIAEIQASEKYGYTSKWYIHKNYVNRYPELSEDNWAGAVRYGEGTSMEKNREYSSFENAAYLTRDAAQAYLEILDHAGVTVPRRDTVDKRVIEDVRTGTATFGNGIIDRVEQVGGWPELHTYDVPLDTDSDGMPDDWETREGLNVDDPSDRFGIKEGEVYDNLERYLNELASDKAYLLPPLNLVANMQNLTEVALSWEDISDDELGFVIQRTDPDDNFITVDTVDAEVTSFTDTPPGPDRTVVYRVFAIADGLRSIPSLPASIELQTGLENTTFEERARIYPNPFEGHFTLEYRSSGPQNLKLRLYDTRARLVAELKDVAVQAGSNRIPVVAGDFPPGIYMLELRPAYDESGFLKLIGN
jgi:pectate lyase